MKPIRVLMIALAFAISPFVSGADPIDPSQLSEADLENLMGAQGTEAYDANDFSSYEMVVSSEPIDALLDGKVEKSVYRGLQNSRTKKLIRWTGRLLSLEWARALQKAGQGAWDRDERFFSAPEAEKVNRRSTVKSMIAGGVPSVVIGGRALTVFYTGLAEDIRDEAGVNWRFLTRLISHEGRQRKIRLGHLFPGRLRDYPFSSTTLKRVKWPAEMFEHYDELFKKVGE